MLVRQFFDPKLAQFAYLIGCPSTGEALLIDPQRDVDRYLETIEDEGLRLTSVAETHMHADFLSGARELAERFDVRLYLSAEGGDDWQSEWAKAPRSDGGAFDVVFLHDGDAFRVGNIDMRALHTPGHTPEHLVYLVVDSGGGAVTPMAVATGDFVFVGDLGRPDLLEQAAGVRGAQETSAGMLYDSLPKFTGLDDHVLVWPAHGAGSTCGKALGAVPVTTVGYEKRYNASLAVAEDGREAFVDAILAGQPEPPLYFARMKRANRAGVPLLGALPRPRKLTARELGDLLDEERIVVIDTRADRSAVMARHLPGMLYAPLDRSFNTVVGSLLVDEGSRIVLIVDETRVEEAVRDLVRIGYDDVVAFADAETLQRYFARGGEAASIDEIGFGDVERLRNEPGTVVLDVRYAAEFAAGHVPNAVNASYTRLPGYTGTRIPAGGTLLVHCAAGARSAVASSFLAREGHRVKYVNDLWSAWREADHPVEQGTSPKQTADIA